MLNGVGFHGGSISFVLCWCRQQVEPVAWPGSIPATAHPAVGGIMGLSLWPGFLLFPAHRHLCLFQQSLHFTGTQSTNNRRGHKMHHPIHRNWMRIEMICEKKRDGCVDPVKRRHSIFLVTIAQQSIPICQSPGRWMKTKILGPTRLPIEYPTLSLTSSLGIELDPVHLVHHLATVTTKF